MVCLPGMGDLGRSTASSRQPWSRPATGSPRGPARPRRQRRRSPPTTTWPPATGCARADRALGRRRACWSATRWEPARPCGPPPSAGAVAGLVLLGPFVRNLPVNPLLALDVPAGAGQAVGHRGLARPTCQGLPRPPARRTSPTTGPRSRAGLAGPAHGARSGRPPGRPTRRPRRGSTRSAHRPSSSWASKDPDWSDPRRGAAGSPSSCTPNCCRPGAGHYPMAEYPELGRTRRVIGFAHAGAPRVPRAGLSPADRRRGGGRARRRGRPRPAHPGGGRPAARRRAAQPVQARRRAGRAACRVAVLATVELAERLPRGLGRSGGAVVRRSPGVPGDATPSAPGRDAATPRAPARTTTSTRMPPPGRRRSGLSPYSAATASRSEEPGRRRGPVQQLCTASWRSRPPAGLAARRA